MGEAPVSNPRFFHGWVIVSAAFGVMFVGFGSAYSFAAFFHSLRDEFHATRSDVSFVFALTGFLYFAIGAASGPVADRFGPRKVIVSGVLLIATGLLLASVAQTLWQVYLTYSLCVGLGVGLAYVPSVGAVQRWFSRRRGFASGLAVAGIGAGTLVMPLLAAGAIDWWGWRPAYLVLGAVAVVVGLPSALLIERSPAARGLNPDGERTSPGQSETHAGVGLSLREALASRPFWLLYIAGLSASLGIFIPFAHLAAYARDHGFSDGFGAFLIGLIGLGSIGGRLLLGSSADRIGRRRALGAAFAAMGLSLLGWLGATENWSLSLFAVAFGVSYGGFVALVPALAADYFGGRSVAGIIGLLYTGAAFGALAGPTLAGGLYDARNSYTLPILLGAGMNVVAVICMAMLPHPSSLQPALSRPAEPGGTDRSPAPAG